jgi:pimeloyl-ACP methyl ester carboxylesterase
MAQLTVNGIKLAYDIHGDGPPLLFIHGLGSCLEDWEYQVADFARAYRVIRFDLRGHGASDKPAGPYSIAMFADDAAALLRALEIADAHVVGISMGGAVAFQLTLDHPQLVKTLTVVNSGPEAVVRNWREKLGVWLRGVIVRKKGVAKLARAIGPRLFPQPENQSVRAAFEERLARNGKEPYLHAFHALIGWSVMERLGDIRCPVYVISADQDYTPLSFKQAYVAKLPNARLEVIEDSRHALPMEKPAAFNAVLARLLGSAPAAG